jgi:hypothetical protein
MELPLHAGMKCHILVDRVSGKQLCSGGGISSCESIL